MALPDLLRADRIHPGFFSTQYNIGITYSHLKEYEKAIFYLSKSLKGEKKQLTYYERGAALYHIGKYADAIKDYNKVLRMKDSHDPYQKVNMGYLYYWRAWAWKGLGDDVKYKSDMELAKQNGYKE